MQTLQQEKPYRLSYLQRRSGYFISLTYKVRLDLLTKSLELTATLLKAAKAGITQLNTLKPYYVGTVALR
jgi:hypothetical protein